MHLFLNNPQVKYNVRLSVWNALKMKKIRLFVLNAKILKDIFFKMVDVTVMKKINTINSMTNVPYVELKDVSNVKIKLVKAVTKLLIISYTPMENVKSVHKNGVKSAKIKQHARAV